MITRKSSSKVHALLPKTLTLDIQSRGPQQHRRSLSETHKIRKLSPSRSPRFAKIEDVLQTLDLSNILPSRHPPHPFSNPCANPANSYLAYKHEQNALKEKHANKLSFLKNKFLLSRQSPETREKQRASTMLIKTRQQLAVKRKMSFITLNAFKNQQQQKDKQNESRKREIYIKTAEGKRQKINADEYFSKIQEKRHQSFKAQLLQFSCNGQESTAVLQRSNGKQQRLKLLWQVRSRNSKKQKQQIKPNDFRPWSSSKSEFLQ